MVTLGATAKGLPVELTSKAREQGVYVIGTNGTGKTTLLKNIIVQDMYDPDEPAICVLDPHGDLTDELLELVPRHRRDKVILFAPGERKEQYNYPIGLNLFDCNRKDPYERELVSSTVISTFKKLFAYSWGPRMEDLLRNGVLTLMYQPESTLLDLWHLLVEQSHRTREYGKFVEVPDKFLWDFWNMMFVGYSPHDKAEIVGSSLNKIGRFLGNPVIRNIVCQPVSAFSLSEIMDNHFILLCNLSKGELGEDNSALLGAVLVNLILIAALRRRDTPIEERKTFHLIVDEYQSFATETFPTLQSEARKFGITVMVAHQYRDQLDELNKGSTLNVANLITLRVSGRDSIELASQYDNTPPPPQKTMQPLYREDRGVVTFDGEQIYTERKDAKGTGRQFHEVELPPRLYSDVAAERANALARLDNHHAQVRILEGKRLREYTIEISPPIGEGKDPNTAKYIRKRSREVYGKDRRFVETFVNKRSGTDRRVWEEIPPPAQG